MFVEKLKVAQREEQVGRKEKARRKLARIEVNNENFLSPMIEERRKFKRKRLFTHPPNGVMWPGCGCCLLIGQGSS